MISVRRALPDAALLASCIWGLGALQPRDPPAPARLAAQLEPGMQLLYVSDGTAQPPWTVDSLRLGAPLRPGAECAVIHLRRRPDQAPPEETRLCLAGDTLYRWDAGGSHWVISRPVGPEMVWAARQPNGDTVRYETEALRDEHLSGRQVTVVHTTLTTSDSAGRPKRRLRERYALSLATATGGIFETPDSTRPGAWLTRQTFELRKIQSP